MFDIIPDENNTRQHSSITSNVYTTVFPEHEGPVDVGENGTVSQRYFIFRKNVESTSKSYLKQTDKIVTGQNKTVLANEVEQRP